MRSICIFLAVLFATVSGAALAEKRVALVIGNSAYQHVPQLSNPRNDAGDMVSKLKGLGFDVVVGQDLDLVAMRVTVREFISKLEAADMALFFYAGHGLQVNGNNYMAPVDAQLTSYNDLDFEALPIDLVLSAMERNAKVNLVFLDACRDNPLAETLARSLGTRSGSVGRGLAKLGTGVGSLIAFSTQPGNVALDGTGRNSPFTAALLKHLGTPGQSVTDDLIQVRREVLEATDGKQVPWDNSSLTGPVVLKPGQREAQGPELPAAPATKPDNTVELAFWNSVKDARSKSYFETYIKRFPSGLFVDIAKLKIQEAEAADRMKAAEQHQPSLQGSNGDLQASLALPDAKPAPAANATSKPSRSTGSPEKAMRFSATDIGPDADPRLIRALKTLGRYEIRYGFFRGHLYIAVLSSEIHWPEASSMSEIAGGHLVTLSSKEENRFVYELFASDDRFVRIGEKGMDKRGPWIGLHQLENSREPNGGWIWVTGEKLQYKNWNVYQPNNNSGDMYANFYSYGTRNAKEEQRPIKWDDGNWPTPGFIVELEGVPETDHADLTIETQKELARLGCLTGDADGIWGPSSKKALQRYAIRQGIAADALQPTNDTLDSLRALTGRLCDP